MNRSGVAPTVPHSCSLPLEGEGGRGGGWRSADANEPTRASDEPALIAAIAAAYDASEPLLICHGNGSKAGLPCAPCNPAARSLSTRALTGISLYSPQELVLSAGAGTPMADIAAATAAKGQHIISEPPDFSALLKSSGEQTLGGVVATNLSGPRRVAWGATRDHVLGVRAVNGIGEKIHSGGRVLKNVTGLDLCKLLAGSHGTLAVLSEITLKVLPAPERRGTLVLKGLDPERAVAALAAALGSPYAVASGAAYLPRALGRARAGAGLVRGGADAGADRGFLAVGGLPHRPAAGRPGGVRHGGNPR